MKSSKSIWSKAGAYGDDMIFVELELSLDEMDKDWKLKLRYGKLYTEFSHYTVLADGEVGDLADGFECRPGRAWMAMKTWATNTGESADMIKVIGEQIGFEVTGKIEVYETEPSEPPQENPHAYDIMFTPYGDQ